MAAVYRDEIDEGGPGRSLGEDVGLVRGELRARTQRNEQRWKAPATSIAERLMRLHQGAVNIASAASLAYAFAGYIIGISSSAFLYFERTSTTKVIGKEYFLATLQIAAALGALLAGLSADVIGRRNSLTVTSFVGALGSLAATAAPSPNLLLLSQAVSGLALGAALVLCPLYVAETAPASHRGMLFAIPEIGAASGFACAALASFLCGANWRRMLALGAVPAVALGGVSLLFLPESPRWLAQTGQVRDAVQALVAAEEREEQAAVTLEEILSAVGQGGDVPLFMLREGTADPQSQPRVQGHTTSGPGPAAYPGGVGGGAVPGKSHGGSFVSVLVSRAHRAAKPWRDVVTLQESVSAVMILALGVAFYQQATGMDATLSYLPEIFAVAGLSSTGAEFAACIGVALSRASAALLSGALVDEFGRRSLLLISSGGAAAALLVQAVVLQILSMGQTLADDTEETLSSFAPHKRAGAAVFAIITTCNFAAFFSLGLGPIVPLVVAESCPLRFRATAVGVATAVNRMVVALLVFSLVTTADATSASVPYLVFGLLSFASVAFCHLSVRELSGKSLEQATQHHAISSPSMTMEDLPTASSSEWAPGVARRSRVSGMEAISPL